MSHALNQLEIIKRFSIQKSVRIYSNDFIEKRKKSKKTEIMQTLVNERRLFLILIFLNQDEIKKGKAAKKVAETSKLQDNVKIQSSNKTADSKPKNIQNTATKNKK